MTDVYRIGAKVFCTDGADLDLEELIPVFHRWIQQKRTTLMLIDVADYTHVPSGPGILLVAHEGNFMVDDLGGRRGLTFYRKQPLAGSLSERLLAVAREAAGAALMLAAEPEFAGRLTFSGGELSVYFNDRLTVPNTEEGFAALKPELTKLFDRALGTGAKLTRPEDPRERLTVTARAGGNADLAALASKLAG
jgi:hypothetical protein